MPIRTETKNGVLLLHIEDEMTIYTAADLKSQLLPHLAQPADLEIDLSQVAELDSAGLQLLILAKREATRLGGALRLSRHSRAVLEVFDLCNLAAFFGDPLVISHSANS
ncbi:anti-anti-sigma factor [Pseudomonas sp. SJZ079]|uniref:STAS domain-containing protein n=1 Tax=Pseudomonas sp. SJZ079 TaxID=2572887 RepID=UPI00119A6709|nr:STAS domain-containing protein [Pseudomonas sp. SJZ079]TWC28177.1 anti-anti-sigma factor [Pseudomonas sp. SJZ079]